jgi:hypothetical protein
MPAPVRHQVQPDLRSTIDPLTENFLADLRRFVSTCQSGRWAYNARIGNIGARPANFITVRWREAARHPDR